MTSDLSPGSGTVQLSALRRSSSDRIVAGVCGGVGRQLGLDPVLLRVVVAGLVVLSGVGVAVYAIAWLLLPTEGTDRPLIRSLGGGRRSESGSRATTRALTVGLVLLALVATVSAVRGSATGVVLVGVAVAGLVAWVRRGQGSPTTPGTPIPPQPLGVPTQATAWPPATPTTSDTPATSTTWAPDPTPPAATGWSLGPDWGPTVVGRPDHQDGTGSDLADAPGRAVTSVTPVTLLVAALAAAAVGVVGGLGDGGSWTVPAAVVTALVVVGLGLLVGSWFGRARGLVPVAGLLVAALLPATLLPTYGFAVGDVTRSPTTPEQLAAAGPVELLAGQVSYDLSDLALDDDDVVTVVVRQGLGNATITVPATADVVYDVDVVAGQADVLGTVTDGFPAQDADGFDAGPTDGGGTVRVQVSIGAGELVVDRAVAP